MTDLVLLCENAKKAAFSLLLEDENNINRALKKAAALLRENVEVIKAENVKDIEFAKKNCKSEGFIDRLLLTDKIISSIAEGLEEVAALSSPTGKTLYKYHNKIQGIKIVEKAVPFGVVGMIYEARPNVTADAFALTLKTKNAVILKGGSDALNSNKILVKILKEALRSCSIDENALSLIEDTSRETTAKFMTMNKYVDLLIPRGGAALIKAAVENSTIPIIETGTGNCHVYVDLFADVKMAADVIFNAKTQRYSVCNACECLVIHSAILDKALPVIAKRLAEKKVEIRADERALKVLQGCGYENARPATEEDFYTEYGAAIISVKTVDDLDQAIAHINEHSTHHSEAIITENSQNAQKFMTLIDSSSVYHNASTRFTDGFVFGFGAEIGISTQKLHARGPMGLDVLTTRKFYVSGKGAVRK